MVFSSILTILNLETTTSNKWKTVTNNAAAQGFMNPIATIAYQVTFSPVWKYCGQILETANIRDVII